MTVYEIIDNALAGACEHYYHAMPEFDPGGEPEKYAVYTVRALPRNFASGKATATEYFISVSVYTPTVDEDYSNGIIAAIEDAGGIFAGENDQLQDVYPRRKCRNMDFLYYQDK